MIKYPIGIQTFEKIIQGDYLYVDKTEYIYNLVSTGVYYFLSRPRRFGKSLLISTLEAYFQGKRELFRGLKIDALEKDWIEYPVLHLDMNGENYTQENAVEKVLNRHLMEWEETHGSGSDGDTPSGRFADVIRRAHEQTGRKVVILIDEYDKSLTATLLNEELNNKFRQQLRAFYGVLKSEDAHIQFALLTGVTKFSKVSIFSDLNHLENISMAPDYQAVCGITDEEIDTYCRSAVEELAQAHGSGYEEMRQVLRNKYDGYHFCEDSVGVYNPFSLMNAFKQKKLKDFWFETGTPEMLVSVIKRSNLDVGQLSGGTQTGSQMGGAEKFTANPLPMMFQTGYLTIKGYDEEFDEYTLDFPNEEVRSGFLNCLAPAYLHNKEGASVLNVASFVRDLNDGNIEQFMLRLQTLFSNLDFKITGRKERDFHNVLHVIFMLLGFHVRVERHTSFGSMDVEVETRESVIVFELKVDGSVDEALHQIDEKQYAAPFALSGKKIYKIGVNFSSEKRTLDDYRIVQQS